MIKPLLSRSVCAGLTGALLSLSLSAQGADNMLFHGTLLAEPCVIAPGDDTIALNFGGVLDNDLYLNGRTPGMDFTLHLINCDISLAQTVEMTFTGTADPKLPGLLALDGGSQAKGIAIGLEATNGSAWPLNQGGQYPLTNGSTALQAKAYIQGESAALGARTITPGDFSATATFTLAYQ